MTQSVEMDHLDNIAASAFPGYLVRKDLVRRYARQYPVPTYVVEFLLGRYCASVDEEEIEEGLAIVEKQLQGRTVRTSDREIFKSRARERGSVKLIDIVRARLDARNDCYVAELPSLHLKDVQVADSIVKDNERMLADGFYADVKLTYDPITAQEKKGRPFHIGLLRPIQMSNPHVLDVLAAGRQAFDTEQWRDFLIRSTGLEPEALESGRNGSPCCVWFHSSNATTTWSNSVLAGRARATFTSRSRHTPICFQAAKPRLPRCSSTWRTVVVAWSANTMSSASTRSPESPLTRRTVSTS